MVLYSVVLVLNSNYEIIILIIMDKIHYLHLPLWIFRFLYLVFIFGLFMVNIIAPVTEELSTHVMNKPPNDMESINK